MGIYMGEASEAPSQNSRSVLAHGKPGVFMCAQSLTVVLGGRELIPSTACVVGASQGAGRVEHAEGHSRASSTRPSSVSAMTQAVLGMAHTTETTVS